MLTSQRTGFVRPYRLCYRRSRWLSGNTSWWASATSRRRAHSRWSRQCRALHSRCCRCRCCRCRVARCPCRHALPCSLPPLPLPVQVPLPLPLRCQCFRCQCPCRSHSRCPCRSRSRSPCPCRSRSPCRCRSRAGAGAARAPDRRQQGRRLRWPTKPEWSSWWSSVSSASLAWSASSWWWSSSWSPIDVPVPPAAGTGEPVPTTVRVAVGVEPPLCVGLPATRVVADGRRYVPAGDLRRTQWTDCRFRLCSRSQTPRVDHPRDWEHRSSAWSRSLERLGSLRARRAGIGRPGPRRYSTPPRSTTRRPRQRPTR